MATKAEWDSNHSVRSITRALRAIERLASAETDLGVVQITHDVNLPHSTAHRILAALAREGYAVQDPHTERYRLALRFVELGGLVRWQLPLCNHARAYVRRLVQCTGESVGLAAFDGLRALVVDGMEDPHRMWPRVAIGANRPLHSAAAGKAILAVVSPAEVPRLLRDGVLPQQTERTIQSIGALQEELTAVRERGYAIEDEEQEQGLRAVACAIRSRNATLGAIEIAGPAVRLSLDRISEVVNYLRSTAEELSLSLGYEVGSVK